MRAGSSCSSTRPRTTGSGAPWTTSRPPCSTARCGSATRLACRCTTSPSSTPPTRTPRSRVARSARCSSTWPTRARLRSVSHVDEARVVALEADGDVAGGAVAVLGPDDVGLAGAGGLLLVDVLAVQQHHDVGVLLDRARLAQVAHHRALVGALLGTTVELGERDDRHVELLGQQLDLAGELRDLDLTGLDLLAAAHQLEVVDHDQLQ